MQEKGGDRVQLSILPSQYYPQRLLTVDTPAARLMHAVLEQAAHDLLHYRTAEDPHDRQLFGDAYRWLIATDRSHPFAFLNLCEALGYSSSAVRRSLLRATDCFFRPLPARRASVHLLAVPAMLAKCAV